ncbi:MAG: hypothetical protein JWO05_973 [Gemmatimonadetes bacterium]|nr:hypothetical protein [Gemmatimonadota bacterium]
MHCRFLVLALFASSVAHAQADTAASHRAAAEQLLAVTKAEKMATDMQSSIFKTMPAMGSDSAVTRRMQEPLRQFMAEEMSFAKMKPEMLDVYTQVFTEAELRQMVDFYGTPLGQLMLDRMPLVLQRSQEVAMKRITAAMPKLQVMIRQSVQDEVARSRAVAKDKQKAPPKPPA